MMIVMRTTTIRMNDPRATAGILLEVIELPTMCCGESILLPCPSPCALRRTETTSSHIPPCQGPVKRLGLLIWQLNPLHNSWNLVSL